MLNPYDVLGVSRSASAEDIRRAYRTLAFECHPDHNPSSDAASRFQQVAEAYATLSDPIRRAAWHEVETNDWLNALWGVGAPSPFDSDEDGPFDTDDPLPWENDTDMPF